MPHYIDGTEAKVGDIVRGKPYNTPYEVVGVVLGITPGCDTCNMRVGFIGDIAAENEPVFGMVYDHGECRAFELVKCAKGHHGRPELPFSQPRNPPGAAPVPDPS